MLYQGLLVSRQAVISSCRVFLFLRFTSGFWRTSFLLYAMPLGDTNPTLINIVHASNSGKISQAPISRLAPTLLNEGPNQFRAGLNCSFTLFFGHTLQHYMHIKGLFRGAFSIESILAFCTYEIWWKICRNVLSYTRLTKVHRSWIGLPP